ncbi:MAG: toprim domain-containing protein [Candidatus Moranbacteria bacterium]|nr:toprim domain-containing protein [Candidatus Moranbacteria bacterium]
MYKSLGLKTGEQNLCPFPHKNNKTGKKYLEKIPSCGINEEGAFHCFVCEKKFTSEDWFTSSYLNCSFKQAEKFNKMLKETRIFLPSKTKWKKNQERLKEELEDEESEIYKYLKELDLLDVIETARMGIYQSRLTLPTFYKGQIINLCQFCPGEIPKYRNSRTAITGIITTTKTFNQNMDYILVAAGEKDMLLATKHGFNAVTILGGEKAKPHYYKNLFRNKKVYIAYDNDKAGMEGAVDLAGWLYRFTKEIKVLNTSDVFNEGEGDLTTVAKEEKEDLTDFFLKYKKTDINLWNIIDNTNWYQPPALENQSVLQLIQDVHATLKELGKRIEEEQKNAKYKKTKIGTDNEKI